MSNDLNISKILNQLDSIIAYHRLAIDKAAMLRRELSGVGTNNSPQRGKGFPEEEKARLLERRTKNMYRK